MRRQEIDKNNPKLCKNCRHLKGKKSGAISEHIGAVLLATGIKERR